VPSPAAGASVGLLLGGVLTQSLSWRWCLYVNLAIAVPMAIAALRLLRNERTTDRPRIDLPGVLIASAGLFALVYGFSSAETSSWSAPITIVALAASVVLLTGFVALERRTEHPLLPLGIVWDRARGGAYASVALVGSGVFAVFLFLTFYMQQDLGFSPVKTGLAFLPLTGTIVLTATTVQTRVLHRTGAKPLVMGGACAGDRRDDPVHAPDAPRELRERGSARTDPHRARGRLHLLVRVLDRDARCEALRGRRRLRDGQHVSAGRWLDRHRPAEHHLRERGSRLRIQSREDRSARQRRIDPRLHHRVLGGRRASSGWACSSRF
jgi:hypothetical protein